MSSLTVHRMLALVSIVLALTFITSWQAFALFGVAFALIGLNLVFSKTYKKKLPSKAHVKHVNRLRTEVQANKPAMIGGATILGALFGLILFGVKSLFVSLF